MSTDDKLWLVFKIAAVGAVVSYVIAAVATIAGLIIGG